MACHPRRARRRAVALRDAEGRGRTDKLAKELKDKGYDDRPAGKQASKRRKKGAQEEPEQAAQGPKHRLLAEDLQVVLEYYGIRLFEPMYYLSEARAGAGQAGPTAGMQQEGEEGGASGRAAAAAGGSGAAAAAGKETGQLASPARAIRNKRSGLQGARGEAGPASRASRRRPRAVTRSGPHKRRSLPTIPSRE